MFARLAGLRDDEAPLGLQWRKIRHEKVAEAMLGKEVTHLRLAKALKSKSSFTLSAWLELQVDDVCSESYIKSGEREREIWVVYCKKANGTLSVSRT